MPPLLAAIPAILGAAGLGLEIDRSLQKPKTSTPKPQPTDPQFNIPGSPLSVVNSSAIGGIPQGPGSLPNPSVLGQIMAAPNTPTGGPGASMMGANGMAGGSTGRSATPPASIGGGATGDSSVLPWLQSLSGGGQGSAAFAAPGTPQTI
jgi:hypothetical protein